jgi:hypothetical protein
MFPDNLFDEIKIVVGKIEFTCFVQKPPRL